MIQTKAKNNYYTYVDDTCNAHIPSVEGQHLVGYEIMYSARNLQRFQRNLLAHDQCLCKVNESLPAYVMSYPRRYMFYTTIAMNLKSHHDPVGKSHFTPTPNSL
jgi:hypothetical protein